MSILSSGTYSYFNIPGAPLQCVSACKELFLLFLELALSSSVDIQLTILSESPSMLGWFPDLFYDLALLFICVCGGCFLITIFEIHFNEQNALQQELNFVCRRQAAYHQSQPNPLQRLATSSTTQPNLPDNTTAVMAPPAKKQKIDKQPIIFKSPGHKPDTCFKVFDQEFHVTSMTLKLNSEFFRTFFEPSGGKVPKSEDSRFTSVWYTCLDEFKEDGKSKSWILSSDDKVCVSSSVHMCRKLTG